MMIESFNQNDTIQLAKKLAAASKPGSIFCLSGDMGAGKTVFAQGFAKGLGIEGYVTSPTFTFVQEYGGGRLPLYHFDVYRIESEEAMADIGYEEYFYGQGVCLVEWADSIRALIPSYAVWVHIEKDYGKNQDGYRKITLTGCDEYDYFSH